MERRGSVQPLDSEQGPPRLAPLPMIAAALVALGLVTWVLTTGEEEGPSTTEASPPTTASGEGASSESTSSTTSTTISGPFGLLEDGRWVLPHLDGGPDVDSADFPDPTLVVVVSPSCSACLGTAAASRRAAELLGITHSVLLVTNVEAGGDALDGIRIWNESLDFDRVAVDVLRGTTWSRSDIMPDAVPLIGLWQNRGWGALLTDAAGARADVIRWRLETGGAFHDFTEPQPWVAPGWEILDAPWTSARWQAVTGVVEESLVVWGGSDQPFDDSAVSSDDGWVWDGAVWATMAESPLCPLLTPGAVVVDDEIFIWGRVSGDTGCAQQAAYRPDTDTWRTLDIEALRRAGSSTAIVLLGDLLVAPTLGVAYDLATASDLDIPASPVGEGTHTRVAAMATADRVYTLGTGALHAWSPGEAEWQRVGPPQIGREARAMALGQGHGVAVNYDMGASIFDIATETWAEPSPVPLRFYECVPQMGSVAGHAVVRMCSGYAVWDAGRSIWVPIIPSGLEGGIAFGPRGVYELGAQDVRYRPIVDGFGELLTPPTVPLGVFFLDLGNWGLVHIEASPDSPTDPFVHVGSFTLEREGETCVVHAFHGLPVAPLDGAYMSIPATRTGNDFPGLVDWSNGNVLVGSRVGSDWVEIQCDFQPDALELAEQLWSPWE